MQTSLKFCRFLSMNCRGLNWMYSFIGVKQHLANCWSNKALLFYLKVVVLHHLWLWVQSMDKALLFSTNIHVTHLVFFECPLPHVCVSGFPATACTYAATQNPSFIRFSSFGNQFFWVATSRMRTPGLWESRGEGKTRLVSVLYFYISLIYASFTFLILFSVFLSFVGSWWSFKWTKSLESI